MTVRALQADGDIATSGTQFFTELADVAQTVSTRLRLFLGEYFRDIEIGTPWYQVILDKSASLSTKDALLRSIIIQTDNVVQLLKFKTDYNIDTRTYTVTASILTTFGEAEILTNNVI